MAAPANSRDDDGASRRTDASMAEQPRPATARLRVLLVDDNEDAIESLEKMLALLGYEVAAATGGRQALALGAVLRPDVAVLDLGMPELNGYELAQAIRREPWGRATRFIALTGWGQPEDIRRSLSEGFEAHLVKPLKTADLVRLMGPPVR
jgi:CheY-like chemotaxis protein